MKILISPYGGGSIAHIVRTLTIADELKKRGHQILFTAPISKKSFIEKAGFMVFGEGHADVNLNDEEDQTIRYFRTHRKQFLNWLGDELAAAEAFEPDIIVNSPTFFGPHVSAKLGIPHVTVINAQWIEEFQGLLGLGKAEKKLSHALLRTIGKPIFARKFDSIYMAEIQSFYKELGIEKIPKKRAELHRNNPILIPSIREFEPIIESQRNDIHYVGPLFWDGFEKEPFEPAKLFPDFKEKPFVYVTLGGSIYRQQSYKDLVKALAKKSDWNILLTLGPNIPRSLLEKDYPHLVIQPFAPGVKVCEQADVIINTASHGTVMQALWHGKPVVGIPHNIDQGTIAARLEELKIGINLNPVGLRDFSNREAYFKKATQISWEKIVATAERVLKDKQIKENAQALKAKLRKLGSGEKAAADLIERYARRG